MPRPNPIARTFRPVARLATPVTSILSTLTLLVGSCLLPIETFGQERPEFAKDIAPLLNRYCVSCHNADDREAGLDLATFAGLSEGGDSGPAVLPGDVAGSRLWSLTSGDEEPRMPPDDAEGPNEDELTTLAAWIKAGAMGPSGDSPAPTHLVVPDLGSAALPQFPITSIAWSPTQPIIALGRFQQIDLVDASTGKTLRTIGDLPGKINSLQFTTDGKRLLSASGVTGLIGQADLWAVETGESVLQIRGHRDTMLSAAISHDQAWIATTSYDRRIELWRTQDGEAVATLLGHNGAVYDIDFSPDDTKLLSASADQTLKVWSREQAARLDTLGQPLKEQWVGAISPDGRHAVGGGGDNRIRQWQLVDSQTPKINPLLQARFAHEGPLTCLAYSTDGRWLVSAAEDQTLKLWQADNIEELHLFPKQSDVVSGIAFGQDPNRFVVSRLDGSWQIIDIPENLIGTSQTQTSSTVAVLPDQTDIHELAETEPNSTPAAAQAIELPAKITGLLQDAEVVGDADFFRFQAQAGEQWMIEVDAARSGSPVDSRVQIFATDGQPVPRVLLQAVRDSYYTFRGKDSSTSGDFRLHNWEEMELNQYLYSNGEVVRLWLYPRGPDSGFKVYPGEGSRWTYFDTTPMTHALGEPCYIVQPYPVDAQLIPNGLPTFILNFENDDDSQRRWGTDSRLTFTAPHDGEFLVKVSDTRGFSGDDFRYTLTIRPRRPDFTVKLSGENPTVSPGSGREFTVKAERRDDFDGEITVNIDNLPPGFHATSPVVIEAGQISAMGVIWAESTAEAPSEELASASTVTATAVIQGDTITHPVNSLGKITLGPEAKVRIRLAPAPDGVSSVDRSIARDAGEATPWPDETPLELDIQAGTTIAATVVVERNDLAGRIPFGNEDSGRNLPHGLIVDNIGLNGLLIIEDQRERDFFITAADWVPTQTRWFHLRAQVDGNQCSLPVKLNIHGKATSEQAAPKPQTE